MSLTLGGELAFSLKVTQAIGRTANLEEIYGAALDALAEGLHVHRAAVLLFDSDGVLRFKASRGLSENYQRAVEGHSPWSHHADEPDPIVITSIDDDASLRPLLPVLRSEGIGALAFIPLLHAGRVIGKFTLYYAEPRALTGEELTLASLIAAQAGFAIARTRAEEQALRSEQRLRFALDAALMGTWDWDLLSNEVRWSENLARIHGLPEGSFDGTFASYEREIHPEDRPRVLASAQRAIAEGVPHDVEYRIVAPDGSIRWCEGKGRVEFDASGRPVRMAGVCVIVTRRKQAEMERLEAAQEASRLKDEFLATLSHELRTPLNAIVGWTRMLQGRMVAADRIPVVIDIIARNAQLQASLVEDILDVSRIITGKLEMEAVELRISPLLERAIQSVAPAAALKRVELKLLCEGSSESLIGDPRRLEQVFTNLLSNAVRFSDEGGTVTTVCVPHVHGVDVEVRDTGAGIDPEFLPFVFERFRQGDSSTTRQHGGLGLGLAIARYLVEQHNGTIGVESAGPRRGATFKVSLPYRSASAV